MRCPKCHYLSFEPEPRCRNCGFDLATHDADPVIKNTDDEGPLVDLDLRRPSAGAEKPASLGQMRPARDVEKPRPPAYRPPAPPRQPEPLDPIAARARSASAVADPPRSQPGRPDFARQQGFRSEQRRGLPPPDLTRPDLTRSDAGRSDLGRPDVARPVSRPEIARPAITRPEAPRPEVARPPAHRPEPPRVDPPRVEQRPQRAPHTTSDLPLFLKRLPDPEPELVVTEPVIAEPVVTKPAAPAPEPVAQDPIIERAPLPEPANVEIDRPLVKVPAVAREPLSVRRPAETTKPKSVEPEIVLKKDPSADRDLLAGMRLFDSEEFEPPVVYRPELRAVGDSPSEPAGPIGRTIAAVLDTAFLAAVGSAVLWITMRVCGLTMSDLPALPALVALPLFAFVLLIDLGYLLLFTAAGGQTLGKMAAGIRVVATSPDTGAVERLDIQRAAFRSFVTLPSVLALGAGFLPALVGERRAVHDRIAQTRVVRA
jgi:uncharacterized RDD family membrane protein YckC